MTTNQDALAGLSEKEKELLRYTDHCTAAVEDFNDYGQDRQAAELGAWIRRLLARESDAVGPWVEMVKLNVECKCDSLSDGGWTCGRCELLSSPAALAYLERKEKRP